MQYKYPRTLHLPFSPGVTKDDKVLKDVSTLYEKEVALSIKMDGENTTMYRDGIHARSLDSRHHESRSWVKGLHSQIKNSIPEGWRICGENLYAKHSIHYKDLRSYFEVFSVWNDNNICLERLETEKFCMELGLETVPTISTFPFNLEQCERLFNFIVNQGNEGIVIRNTGAFAFADFQNNVVKAVRKNHVQTDEHWMNQVLVPNKLR